MLSTDQIVRVQQTWPQVEAVADHAARVFYARLFAIDPEASALFAATDMRQQREKLMITLREIVRDLGHIDLLTPRLHELGQRHAAYGVKPAHYKTVGEAMLWMLEKVLDPAFTTETRQAWTEAYQLIATLMCDASD